MPGTQSKASQVSSNKPRRLDSKNQTEQKNVCDRTIEVLSINGDSIHSTVKSKFLQLEDDLSINSLNQLDASMPLNKSAPVMTYSTVPAKPQEPETGPLGGSKNAPPAKKGNHAKQKKPETSEQRVQRRLEEAKRMHGLPLDSRESKDERMEIVMDIEGQKKESKKENKSEKGSQRNPGLSKKAAESIPNPSAVLGKEDAPNLVEQRVSRARARWYQKMEEVERRDSEGLQAVEPHSKGSKEAPSNQATSKPASKRSKKSQKPKQSAAEDTLKEPKEKSKEPSKQSSKPKKGGQGRSKSRNSRGKPSEGSHVPKPAETTVIIELNRRKEGENGDGHLRDTILAKRSRRQAEGIKLAWAMDPILPQSVKEPVQVGNKAKIEPDPGRGRRLQPEHRRVEEYGYVKEVIEDDVDYTTERWTIEPGVTTRPRTEQGPLEMYHVGSLRNKVEIIYEGGKNPKTFEYAFGPHLQVPTNQTFRIRNLVDRVVRIEFKVFKK
jgi:hypothetical protein